MREEGVILEDVAQIPAPGRDLDTPGGIEEDPLPHHDPPRIRGSQTGDGLQGEALAGPRGAEQDDDILIRAERNFQVKNPPPRPQPFLDVHQDFHRHSTALVFRGGQGSPEAYQTRTC